MTLTEPTPRLQPRSETSAGAIVSLDELLELVDASESETPPGIDLEGLVHAAAQELDARPDTNVSVKAIITDQNGQVLVLEAGYHDWHDLPGGHLQQGEAIEAGLRREIREETGLEVGPITQSGPARSLILGRKRTVVIFYTTEVLPNQTVALSEEHSNYQWVKPRDVNGLNLGVFARPVLDALADRKPAEPSANHHETVRAAAAKVYDGAIAYWLGGVQSAATAAVFSNPPANGGMSAIQGAIAGAAAGFAVVLAAAARNAYSQASQALRADRGVHAQPSEADEEAFIDSRRAPLESFPSDVKVKLIATIQRGVAGGEDARAIARRVKEAVAELEPRARTIAETEAQVTYGIAQSQALKLAGYAMKRWVSCRDERVRDSHVTCDQQGAIPVDQPFANGLMHPGDPNGPPEEVINCRCDLEGYGAQASGVAGPERPPEPTTPPEDAPVTVKGVSAAGDIVERQMTYGQAESWLQDKITALEAIKERLTHD